MNGLSPQQVFYLAEILSLGSFTKHEIQNLSKAAVEYLDEERPKLISEIIKLVNSVKTP